MLTYDDELDRRIRRNFYNFLIDEIQRMRDSDTFRGTNYDVLNALYHRHKDKLIGYCLHPCINECQYYVSNGRYKCINCGNCQNSLICNYDIPNDILGLILDYAQINPLSISKTLRDATIPNYSKRILMKHFSEYEIMKFIGKNYVRLYKNKSTVFIEVSGKFEYKRNGVVESISNHYIHTHQEKCWYILSYLSAKMLIYHRAKKIEERYEYKVRKDIVDEAALWYHKRNRKLSHKIAYLFATALDFGINYQIKTTTFMSFNTENLLKEMEKDLEQLLENKIM